MSTVAAPLPALSPALESGDRLTRFEFERRYFLEPRLKKAELVEGVVYIGSPVRHALHARPHAALITWLGNYAAVTPGVDAGDNATVILDSDNEVQPDAFLRLERGTSKIGSNGYLEGPPELVVEIAASSASYDLHDKKEAYRRSGAREYLVVRTHDGAVDWFQLVEGRYEPIPSDAEGVLSSRVFPGLRLDTRALLSGELSQLLARGREGTDTQDHRAFADLLAGRSST
jgi:Uma2 family endonuclease